jgi:hypothetical protein
MFAPVTFDPRAHASRVTPEKTIAQIMQDVRDETRAHHVRLDASRLIDVRIACMTFAIVFCCAFPFVMT